MCRRRILVDECWVGGCLVIEGDNEFRSHVQVGTRLYSHHIEKNVISASLLSCEDEESLAASFSENKRRRRMMGLVELSSCRIDQHYYLSKVFW